MIDWFLAMIVSVIHLQFGSIFYPQFSVMYWKFSNHKIFDIKERCFCNKKSWFENVCIYTQALKDQSNFTKNWQMAGKSLSENLVEARDRLIS